MVTLFGTFDVGSRALLAQQLGLNITGHNIANANTPGFSRQRVNLETARPLDLGPGALPTGVRVESIQRMRDLFLDFQIRTATSDQGFLDKNEDVLSELETIFQDPLNPIAGLLEDNPSEAGINSLFSRFFGAFQELSAHPESIAIRATVRETAISLAKGFNTIRTNLDDLTERLNGEVKATVDQINGLLERIGKLNEQIVKAEADPSISANDLRDLRDQLLNDLSEQVPITATEQANGQVDVRILGTGVVVGNRVSPFEAVADPEDPTGIYQILNSVERARVLTMDITSGKLGALIEARDSVVPGFIDKIDTVTGTLIREVNHLHSESIGLDGFATLTGSVGLSDPLTVFSALDLADPPQAGNFVVRVTDSNGVVQNLFTVNFDPAVDTLTDLANRIDAIDGVAGPGGGSISASVTSDNRLQIDANGGLEFTFQGDTSNVLSALGMNTFFAGSDASDITVSDFILDVTNGLRRIAASSTGAPGDNGGALSIARIQEALVADGNTATIGDSYRTLIAELGVRAQRNTSQSSASASSLKDLQSRQESTAGVSLDEEAVNLIRYQHAFSAAARYITTVDSLIERVVNGLGVTR